MHAFGRPRVSLMRHFDQLVCQLNAEFLKYALKKIIALIDAIVALPCLWRLASWAKILFAILVLIGIDLL